MPPWKIILLRHRAYSHPRATLGVPSRIHDGAHGELGRLGDTAQSHLIVPICVHLRLSAVYCA
jgi:hypothetical protein